MNAKNNEELNQADLATDTNTDAKSSKRLSIKTKIENVQVVYHWTRLRFYKSRYDSWSTPHTREKVNIGEIRKFGSKRTSVVFSSWQNKVDGEQVQLTAKEISEAKQEAIARLIQAIVADPEKARADLDSSPVTEGMHGHEINVRVTTGIKTMEEETKTLLEWHCNAMFIEGGLLGEIAEILGDETNGSPEPLRLPDGRKAIFDGEMNVVEELNHDRKPLEDRVVDMWLNHYNEHKQDWWRVAKGGIFGGLENTKVCVLLSLQKRKIDWRAELTPEEVSDAEAALGETLDDYDYKPE